MSRDLTTPIFEHFREFHELKQASCKGSVGSFNIERVNPDKHTPLIRSRQTFAANNFYLDAFAQLLITPWIGEIKRLCDQK